MLIRARGGIFLPSDLYQVQDHSWVIWLIEALLLQSWGRGGNDRSAAAKSINWSLVPLLSATDSAGVFV